MGIGTIRVHPAESSGERQRALEIRAAGYRRHFSNADDANDDLDDCPNCTLLIAYASNNQAVGTLRILDGSRGPIELDSFVAVDRLLAPTGCPRSCAEATRLSVPPCPKARQVKLALWKAFFAFCDLRGRRNMLVWGRPPAARQYRRLLFEDFGEKGEFVHPRFGDYKNRTLWMDMRVAKRRLLAANHPLHGFFFEEVHPKIRVQ